MSRQTPAHGDIRAYRNGCRCRECREANRVYNAAARARRRSRPELADAAGHGKPSTYNNHACRCTACRAAHAAYMRDVRASRRTTKGDQ